MNKYENGKVYMIESASNNMIYYGSTCTSLSKRLWQHKNQYQQYKDGKRKHKVSSFEILDCADCKIVLVENFECETKEQLLAREAYYIRNNECVNKNIPLRTHKEWLIDNKEIVKKYEHKYNLEHIEERRKLMKDWYENNKEYVKVRDKQKYEDNKVEISEKRKIKVECQCGTFHHKASIARHRKKCSYFLSSLGAGINKPNIVEIKDT